MGDHGKRLLTHISSGKIVSNELVIALIRSIVFSGNGENRFILSGFPNLLEQVAELEDGCCSIEREIYFSRPDQPMPLPESKLDQMLIETLFYKRNTLHWETAYNQDTFSRVFSSKMKYVFIWGPPLSGKSLLAKRTTLFGYSLIDFPTLIEGLKKKLSTEEEAVEEVSNEQILKELRELTHGRKNREEKFVIDGFPFEKLEDNLPMFQMLGVPERVLELVCPLEAVKARYKVKNEVEDLGEEQVEEIERVTIIIFIYQ